MEKININKNLFDKLKLDYGNALNEINKFNYGIDYLESMIKFFGALSAGVLKENDEEFFHKVLFNFKTSPSLGDYAALFDKSYLTIGKKTKNKEEKKELLKKMKKNKLYEKLYDVFTDTVNLKLIYAEDIINGNFKVKDIKCLKDLIGYGVNFRNKLKGHGAVFDEKDEKLANKILENLEKLIITLEKIKEEILNIEGLEFFADEEKVFAKYQNKTYQLYPFMLYHKCDKFSCKEEHRVKLFFYNDGKSDHSYYLDYEYNHYYRIEKNDIDNLLKSLTLKIETASDENKHLKLLSNFVGREKEIDILKSHILKNIKKPTFAYIVGKPGVGKSALMAKLAAELENDIKSYIFYSINLSMGGDEKEELKKVYSSIEKFIKNITKDNQIIEGATVNIKFEKLFKYFEEKSKEPVLLIIDGIDEFKNWQYIVDSIPLNFFKKIHLIFTSRDYDDIVSHIEKKVTQKPSIIKLTTKNKNKTNYYFTLGRMNKDEVKEYMNSVIPKEIREDKDYENIIDTIILKSEALPLYLDYLTTKIKEADYHINEFKEKMEELPEKLEAFYEDSFKNASGEAVKILILLYFSFPNVEKKEIEILFKNLGIVKDVQEFQKVFNEIEIFLYESNGKYSFYHQSVREAIETYLQNTEDLFLFDNEKTYELLYFKPTEKYIYLHKDGDTFSFIERIIETLKQRTDLEFYEKNFFHLYYQYIHFRMYQEMLGFKDVKQKNYEKLLDYTRVGKEIKKLINDFFERFDSKENKYLYEIRYAYNLAFLIEDYERVLDYMNEYFEYYIDLLINLIFSLKENNILELINNFKYVIDDDFKAVLCVNKFILKNMPDLSLKILSGIFNDWIKAKVLYILNSNISNENKLIKEKIKDYLKDKKILNYFNEIEKKPISSKERFDKEKYTYGFYSDVFYLNDCINDICNLNETEFKENVLDHLFFLYEDGEEKINSIHEDMLYELLFNISSNCDNKMKIKLLFRFIYVLKYLKNNYQMISEIIKYIDSEDIIDSALSYVKTIKESNHINMNLFKKYFKSGECEKAIKYFNQINGDSLLIRIFEFILKEQANDCMKIFLDKFEFKNYRDKYFYEFIYYIKTGDEKRLMYLIRNIKNNFILIFNYYYAQSSNLFNIFYFILNCKNINGNIKAIVKNFIIEENKYTYFGGFFQNIDNNKKIMNEINELLKRKNSANSYMIGQFVSNVVKNIIDFVEFSYIKNILQLFECKEVKEDLFVFVIKRLESNKLNEEYDYIIENFFTLSNVYKLELIKTCFLNEEKFKNLKCVYTKQYLIGNTDVSETLEILSTLAPNEVLKYFGIETEENGDLLDELLKTAYERIESIDKTGLELIKEKEKILNEVKYKILEDEELFETFMKEYGKQLGLKNKQDFDEYFSEIYEEIIKLEVKNE